MPPTQANQLDTLEEGLQSLQESIPKMTQSLEERFNEMKHYFEEKQNKIDECSKNQEEMKYALTVLMADVKAISSKMEDGERSQSRPLISSFITREENSANQPQRENTNSSIRRLEFPIFNGDEPNGWILKAKRYFDCCD